jgi:hypothetical protein
MCKGQAFTALAPRPQWSIVLLCFDQCGHHQVLKSSDEETAVYRPSLCAYCLNWWIVHSCYVFCCLSCCRMISKIFLKVMFGYVWNACVLSPVWVTQRGFGFDIGFIDNLQIVTTSNYNSLMELHTLNITITTEHIKSSQSSLVISWQEILVQ